MGVDSGRGMTNEGTAGLRPSGQGDPKPGVRSAAAYRTLDLGVPAGPEGWVAGRQVVGGLL